MTVDESIIRTSSGFVRGIVQDTYRAFKGIPYAIAGRWEAPRKVDSWEGVRDAVEFGDRFPQAPSPLTGKGPFVASNVPQSERGHHINVYTPRAKDIPADGLPVLVWIYGGALMNGSGDLPLYNIPQMMIAAEPAVFITFNYRVNVFGFLASKELAAASADGAAGNYGLLDQQAALEWVQENVTAFGGNRKNVTVYGESAGACSIGYQIILTRNLFHRAILQSGTASTMTSVSVPKLQPLFDRLVELTACPEGANKLGHLMSVPWEALLAKTLEAIAEDRQKYLIRPALDGVLIKEHPAKSIKEGNVDIGVKEYILGEVKDEGTLFTLQHQTPETFEAFLNTLPAAPALHNEIRKLYPESIGKPAQRAAEVFGDVIFKQPVRFVAKNLAVREGVKVYKYRWEKPMEATKPFNLGVHHAIELPFLFQSPFLTPEEKTAANDITRKWVHFAASGAPGDDWQRYEKQGGSVYVFGEDGGKVVNEGSSERLDFWERVQKELADI